MLRASRMITTVGLLASALAAPASADRAEWAGFTCGFSSSNDPTGVINQDPNAQVGVMNTGIMLAADLLADDGSGLSPHIGLDSPTSITQHCWIQINSALYGEPAIPTADCTFESIINGVPGPVLMLPQACTIAYSAGIADNVYQCTKWYFRHGPFHDDYRWHDPDGTAVHEDDAGYGTAECSLAISAG